MPLINNSIFALAGSSIVVPTIIAAVIAVLITVPVTWFIAIENSKVYIKININFININPLSHSKTM